MSTPADPPEAERRTGELTFVELLRWSWRQLTSMRTALVLLLLVALAAVPGSIVPQDNVDSFEVTQWKERHPDLTPVYERLGLFSVYDSPWFAATYILLMISLVGCILPRLKVYAQAVRARPPRAPRNLTRLPDHAAYRTEETAEDAGARLASALRRRRYRVVDTDEDPGGDVVVSAERGYLREAGNLLFHLSVLIVLVGFGAGSMLGYQGGAIVLVGNGFSNNLTQYDDFDPGSLWTSDDLDPFAFTVDDFDIEWYDDMTQPSYGQARSFVSHLTYTDDVASGDSEEYDLRVNHPLSIGSTDVFLIGHGYAPVLTVRAPDGTVAYSGPTIFLPTDLSFRSFGVVKVSDGLDTQVGLEGEFYPSYGFDMETGPYSYFGDALEPAMSMTIYTGDLGVDSGVGQSVYSLEKDGLTQQVDDEGNPLRLDLEIGETAELPGGLGTVTFDGYERWNRVQISQTPGKLVALGGVVLALVGLLGSLFIRPRRIWVRVRAAGGADDLPGTGATVVTIGLLDRSTGAGGGEEELQGILDEVRPQPSDDEREKQ
ncbi:cytochrome c biogenesis protein ResB [Nocardioides zeae]|uniref:Cytochrome c biogenesis protein ResB n=1 Tax=Nocardioides imazamoxiresistens TaxID=3231893 RepID=A0ABU3PZY5_9ACTN|nr:cytochrome c biogenesis protein ResB [Nocardioides zeae]MDT9594815.1 cytochrome c biogenesis protein ResB [Nocardioides zeae]